MSQIKYHTKILSLEEVLAQAEAAYSKHVKENPKIYYEGARAHFVRGWLEQSYRHLYERYNTELPSKQ